MKEVEGERNKIFIRIFGSILHVFAADVCCLRFSLTCLTKSCSFWYGPVRKIISPFTSLMSKLSMTVKTYDFTSVQVNGNEN